MGRHVLWSMVFAVAWTASSVIALADDAESLNLPTAISPESLAKTSARGGATATADAAVEEDSLHANATATATIDDAIVINGPVTTGSINPGSFDSGTASQVSTGIGNIQQGVQATAISF